MASVRSPLAAVPASVGAHCSTSLAFSSARALLDSVIFHGTSAAMASYPATSLWLVCVAIAVADAARSLLMVLMWMSVA
jgi:hypothetical protein